MCRISLKALKASVSIRILLISKSDFILHITGDAQRNDRTEESRTTRSKIKNRAFAYLTSQVRSGVGSDIFFMA
jgi:hypothetical protein